MDFIRQHAVRWSTVVFHEEAFERAMMKLAQRIATEIARGTIAPCATCSGNGVLRKTNHQRISFEEACHDCLGYGLVEVNTE